MQNDVADNQTRTVVARWSLVGVLLLAYALRVYKLADKTVWFDEGWNAWMSRFEFADIITKVSTDTAPPLHFFILHVWRDLIGESEFSLRYVSLIAGFLAVAVTYQIGRKVGGQWVGILAALLLALSRFHVSWSQEIRMYTLGALFAALAFWGALRVWDGGRRADYLLYILSMTLGLYNHYLAAFVLVAINAAWLVQAAKDRRLRPILLWILTQIITVALFLPWLLYAIGRMRSWSAESPITLGTFFQVTWAVLTVGIPAGIEQFRPLTLPLAVVFGVGLLLLLWQARQRWQIGRDLVLLLGGLLLPGLLIFLLALPGRNFLYTPPVAPRYFMLFVSAYAVLLAWAIGRIGSLKFRPVGWLLAAFACWVAIAGLRPYYPGRLLKDNYQSLAATISAYRQPSDAVVLQTDVDWPTFDFYLGPGWYGVPSSWQLDPTQVENYLSPIWAENEAVWLVVNNFSVQSDPNGLMAAWLADKASSQLEHKFGNQTATLFAKNSTRTNETALFSADYQIQHRLEDVAVDDNYRLLGYDLALTEFESGDQIALFLNWKDALPSQDPLALELKDASGKVWQSVSIAPSARLRQQVNVIVPPEAPSGEYRFGLDSAEFGAVTIRQKVRQLVQLDEVNFDVPLPTQFGDGVKLLGYDLEILADAVPLTLYWQATETVPQRYKVFAHFLGEQFNPNTGNPLWGQQDNEPVNGTRPTTLWRTDEVIVDQYTIPIDPNRPAGNYQIVVGLYDPVTGTRLPILAGDGTPEGDQVVLTELSLDP